MSELRYRPPPVWMARFSTVLHSKLDVLEAHSLSEVRPCIPHSYSHPHQTLP